MPQPDSPQLRQERIAGVVAVAAICLAVPSVILLIVDAAIPGTDRRIPAYEFVAAAIVGFLLPFLYNSTNRAPGFAAYAAFAWLVALIVGIVSGNWPGWAHGLPLGLIVGSITRGVRGPAPRSGTFVLLTAAIGGALLAWFFTSRDQPYDAVAYVLLALAVFLIVWICTQLFRSLLEVSLEPAVGLMYRIRSRGPGLKDFPRTGPCLVLANHACWFDPIFLGKDVPRPITPMMTARFYDLPVIRWVMVAFGVIRVPEKAIKKNAPEIQEAIAALDRGECVVVYPEGYLRRTEEQPLRRFGQGVWQILKARPDTPVFAFWIEGGWGSYTSYYNGPPTKNKWPDFRRRIDVGISAPVLLPAEVLTDNLPTRIFLMNLVAQARLHLGLPALAPFELPHRSDDADDAVTTSESP